MKRRTRANKYHEEVTGKKLKIVALFSATLICTILFVGSVVYLIFLSPMFRVRYVEITGMHYVNKAQVEKDIHMLYGENIFLVQLNSTRFKNTFPLVKSFSLSRSFPSTVSIAISEYPPFAMYRTNTRTYIVSQNGLVIDNVQNTSTKYTLPLIIVPGDIDTISLPKINQYIEELENDKAGFITNFTLEPPTTIIASYTDGHTVLYSTQKSLSSQLALFKQIRQNFGASKCMHLDLRFENIYCQG